MVDVGLDLGVVLGGLALAMGIMTLVYTRSQVKAARLQADEASRGTSIEINRELSGRSREFRGRMVEHPEIIEDMVRESNPSLGQLIEEVGSPRLYLFYRDMMDMFQDVYNLHKQGIVSESDWGVYQSQMKLYGSVPRFNRVFRWAMQKGLLQQQFVSFFESIFKSKELGK